MPEQSDLAEIFKSSRHQAIVGKFGEYLVCNWLSRSGFEVTHVDHTGIDVVAYHPTSQRRLGISVKSRTRNKGKELTAVYLISGDDKRKIVDACRAFGCEPYLAIYVETAGHADLYILSLDCYEHKYKSSRSKVGSWKMRNQNMASYSEDSEVMHIRSDFAVNHWKLPPSNQ